jgi:phosphohistidine phosphatase
MKSLFILRHGKTQPDAPQGDHARELKPRGVRDSAAMGEYITALGEPLQAIVTSTAVRARQTAQVVASVTGFTGRVTVEPRIYAADVASLLQVVRELPDAVDRVVLVGHNPGFEGLTAALAGQDEDEIRLPTAGMAHLTFDVERWNEVQEGGGQLQEIMTPRKLAEQAEE